MSDADIAARLDEGDDDFAPGWREDEPIIGKLVVRTTREGKFGPYEIDTVEREDGSRVAIHRTSKALKEDLAAANIGDEVGVKFLGRHPERGYKRYKIVIESAENDWHA